MPKALFLFVFTPDHIQAIQNQIFPVDDATGAGIQDAFGKLAGGNSGGVLAQLGAKTRHQAINHNGSTQYGPGVQAAGGVGGKNAARRGFEVYMGELACVADQGI